MNYTEMKDYRYHECMGKAHDGNVGALIFVEEHTLLISASGDRSISIHDDSKVKNGTGRRGHTSPPAYATAVFTHTAESRRCILAVALVVASVPDPTRRAVHEESSQPCPQFRFQTRSIR